MIGELLAQALHQNPEAALSLVALGGIYMICFLRNRV